MLQIVEGSKFDPKDSPVQDSENEFFDMITRFVEVLPHARALGMKVVGADTNEIVIEMPYDERFIGDPESGVLHGGAISALMDTCGGAAAFAHPENLTATATIDLRIDYMRPARPGQSVRAKAHCYHVTRNVAFVRAVAVDDDESRPVATATGAFTFKRKKPENLA